ncbi:MAG TPA: ATP-binding protein [Streptosporangiaceae bacterium]|nr:ATP-binding protein [Streptosporangiaceae bacterium]
MTAMFQGSVGVACRAPAVTHRSCLDLAVAPSAVRSARHWAANLLTQAEFDQDLIETTVLLVSELVTNAIHAVSEVPDAAKAEGRPRVWLAIERSPSLVRVEVHDTACVPIPPPSSPRDPEEESGRGLEVIGALATYWGWHPDSVGKVAWCELVL